MDILETHAYDRRQRRNMSCALLLSLSPFFLASAAYLFLWAHDSSPPSIIIAGFKAAPVLLLAAMVLGWNGWKSLAGVAGGLLLSAVGDFCLVWPELFIHGMGAFAAAHLLFSLAFLTARYVPRSRTSSLSVLLYIVMFGLGAAFYVYIYPFLRKAPDSELLTPGVGVYVGLLTLMANLALRTSKVVTILGSLSFLVSDSVLALQVFKVCSAMEHGHAVVMVTYYLAQMLIAMGDVLAVEDQDDFSKWKRS
ncbi:lysoplasmalogenase [Gadus morhua]|uniref:lysoplasmalogenase n=1 Tax=Gadus morhua TaxID=8049 RepID=A0A8C4ZJV1_GADMO|nr:lysoplasmalogenase-like [Gadus morhua]XP_030237753.1 lysoplasmalogenase-like [Gadus morhua]